MSAIGVVFFDPIVRATDATGNPISGATWFFFESDTDTPTPVYSDATLDTSIGTSIVSDGAGRFPMAYLDPAVAYRARLEDASSVLIRDVDPYYPRAPNEPPGAIVMYFGSAVDRDIAFPPTFWEVCDGDNGTPDMRDRMPVGVSGTKTIGLTGGSGTGTTSSNGAHTHTGSTGSVVLTSANMPVHHHRIYAWNVNGHNTTLDGFATAGHVSVAGEVASGGAYITNNAGADQIIEDTGTASPDGHTHSISSDGAHTHTVDTQGPWLALWFLMRKT